MRHRRAWWWWALAGLVFALTTAFWLLTIMLDESRRMSRYSLDSLILVPAVLRDLPEVEVEGDVTFHSSCGDGPKPASDAVWYDSRASAEVLRREVMRHLRSRGFDGDGGVLDGPGASIVLSLEPLEGTTSTHLEVWRYPSD